MKHHSASNRYRRIDNGCHLPYLHLIFERFPRPRIYALSSHVFLQPATVHHDQKPGVERALRGVVIDDAFLQPDSLRADGDCFINGFAGFF